MGRNKKIAVHTGTTMQTIKLKETVSKEANDQLKELGLSQPAYTKVFKRLNRM